jgi:hypothetical protein
MLDLKSIAEIVTGIAALVAAFQASLAKSSSEETKENVESLRAEIKLVLIQNQAINQQLSHVQQTNVHVYSADRVLTSGAGVRDSAPIFESSPVEQIGSEGEPKH